MLIVDQLRLNRYAWAGLCDLFDCSSESVDNDAAAMAASQSAVFDLVLLGVQADAGTAAAAGAIRALSVRAGAPPVIALAARADAQAVARFRDWGAADVVVTPATPARLRRAIFAALRLPDEALLQARAAGV